MTEITAILEANQIFHSGKIVAWTDGGLLNGNRTFGYVWEDPTDASVLAQGNGRVPGQTVSMSSMWTKLCGLLATLTHVRLVIGYFHMVLPRHGIQTIVYCNSKAAM